MSILDHFEETNNGSLILKLKPEERDPFLSRIPQEYRRCYITDKKIEEVFLAHKEKVSSKEIIQSKIPDPGSVMA